MGLEKGAKTRGPRTVRKLIGGVEYTYDQAYDMIHTGSPRFGAVYDRTQVLSPVDLCVELTTHCNFRCVNCFSHSWRGLGGIHADSQEVRRAIEKALPSIVRVCLTGGEPLLHPQIEQLLDLPSLNDGCGFVLSTNGTGHPKLVAAVQEHPWLVAISLHGSEKVHNCYTGSTSFRRVERQVRQLATTNVVHLYCVLHDGLTSREVEWLLRFRDEVGSTFLRFILPRPFGRYRPLANVKLIEDTTELLDVRAGIKMEASKTRFLSSSKESRMTS